MASRANDWTQVTDLPKETRKDVLSRLVHVKGLSVGAAKAWFDIVALAAKPDVSQLPGLPGFSPLAVVITYPLDVAADLLDAQRAFAVRLADALAPTKSV